MLYSTYNNQKNVLAFILCPNTRYLKFQLSEAFSIFVFEELCKVGETPLPHLYGTPNIRGTKTNEAKSWVVGTFLGITAPTLIY